MKTIEIPSEPVRDASITDEQADRLAAKLDEQGFPRTDGHGRTLSLGMRLAMAVGLAGRYDAPLQIEQCPVCGQPWSVKPETYYAGFEKGYQAAYDEWATPSTQEG